MSKIPRLFLLIAAATFSYAVPAQDIEAKISIDVGTATGIVEGRFLAQPTPTSLTFLSDYAGIALRADRVRNISFADGSFRYTVDLSPMPNQSAAAHVSWKDESRGILMLDDILPQSSAKTARIRLELPAGWQATATDYLNSMDQREPSAAELNNLTVADIEKGVIHLGRDHRRRIVWWGKACIVFNFRDEWQFNIDEGLWAARTIFSEYEKVFGSTSAGNYLVGLNKFPNPTGIGVWEADTRGRTVTIISSDTPFKSQSIQRLHEQLRHEMFHLWIPNGVNLTGNYDWFYEGFALYQSLKMGVAVNRLRFDDYLDTLSRAYDIDRRSGSTLSLIDASKNRWNGNNNTQLYARGMLAAFLCDLALLDASNGKRSTDHLLREIYSRYRPPSRETDGNEAVLATLRSSKELVPIIDAYITGTNSIKSAEYFKVAGIEPASDSAPNSLKVVSKPTGRQKNLLDKLGYNSWRKV